MSTITEDPIAEALEQSRQRTLDLISRVDTPALEAVHSPLMSPLVWDLGHIAAFEDLWISRTFGTAMLEEDLVAVYDADETPRAKRGDLPFLHHEAALDYLRRTRANTLAALESGAAPEQDRRLELIIRHELQHNETMCQTLQIAGLACGLNELGPLEACVGDGLELVDLPGGEVTIGWDRDAGFAYDNESPRYTLELAPYRIAASPVSNRAWQAFIDAGGYERRELWSAEGWEWRLREAAVSPLYWSGEGTCRTFDDTAATAPDAPVCHVSGFEADAFARHHGLRLATEFEWEAAATSAAISGAERSVWQWTASEFHPYPGFRADPYPEYSEQFFGHGYRVLRGGSWVSSPRVATLQFRNWDHLQRRQIFSGLRVAADA